MKRISTMGLAALALMVVCSTPCWGALTDYQQAVMDDNPLLYWTFDEAGNTDPANSLANNTPENVMTPQAGASRAASTTTLGGVSLGRAASINGAAGSMFFAPDLFGDPTPGGNNNPGFDFISTQLWAVEFWINTSSASNQYISEVFDGAGNSNNPGLIYNFITGPKLEMFGGGGRWGAAPVTPSEWHHVVGAFYGNSGGFADNLREFYVDGVLTQDTTSAFSAGHGLGKMSIGNATNGSNPINGLIDEYAIYELGNLPDLAARQAHVADIVQHRLLEPSNPPVLSAYQQAVLADGPLKYWTFDEASGAAIEQVSSLPADSLSPQGNATRIASTTTSGGASLGSAAEFDGVNGTRFYAADLAGTEVGTKWAVEMWAQLDDPLKDSYFVESAHNNPSLIHGYNNNVFELFQGTRTGAGGPQALADGLWHHIVVGNDTTGSHTIIVDGGAPQTFPGTGGSIPSPFSLLDIGVGNIAGGNVDGGIDGRMDELAFYDLSTAPDFGAALGQIAGHYSVVPEPSSLVLLGWAVLLLGGTRLRRRGR